MIRYARPRHKRDSTIPLINVVFLMLIFFLIAGTIATPLDPDLELVDTRELEGRDPPDTLVLRRDGTLRFQGSPIDPETYMARHATEPVRIVPDRDALGGRLIEVTAQLRAFGAQSVLLVTRQALE